MKIYSPQMTDFFTSTSHFNIGSDLETQVHTKIHLSWFCIFRLAFPHLWNTQLTLAVWESREQSNNCSSSNILESSIQHWLCALSRQCLKPAGWLNLFPVVIDFTAPPVHRLTVLSTGARCPASIYKSRYELKLY